MAQTAALPEDEGKVRSFFENLQFRLDTMKELDSYHASEFNFFRYIHRDENKVSDVIADLLNPKGSHGQGPLLLRLFLNVIKVSRRPNELGEAVITREHHLNEFGRIDITVAFGNSFAVGIENKPWAGEQPNQVERYCDRLERKFNGQYVLVFLSPEGTDPTSIGRERRELLKKERKLVPISYKTDVKHWLDCCWKECRAERVRWLLRDFSQYVGVMEVGRMIDSQSRKLVTEYLIKNPDQREIAALVHEVLWVDVLKGVAAGFLEKLESALLATVGNGWQVNNPREQIVEKFKRFALSGPEWERRGCVISLEPQDNNANTFFIGVQKTNPAVPPIAGLKEALDERLGPGNTSEWWHWEQLVDDSYRNWADLAVLRQLQTDDAVLQYFKERFETIANVTTSVVQ